MLSTVSSSGAGGGQDGSSGGGGCLAVVARFINAKVIRYFPFTNGRADSYLFFQLFLSIWVAISAGAVWCFSLIIPALSRVGTVVHLGGGGNESAPPGLDQDIAGSFSFSAEDIAVISTVGVIMSYCSLPTGWIFDKYGPRRTLYIGAFLNIVGWTLLYLIFASAFYHHRLAHADPALGRPKPEVSPFHHFILTTLSPRPTVTNMAVSYGIAQLACSYYETGTVLTNLESFSLHQGRIVMIQKTFMGLGGSIMATLFNAFFYYHTGFNSDADDINTNNNTTFDSKHLRDIIHSHNDDVKELSKSDDSISKKMLTAHSHSSHPTYYVNYVYDDNVTQWFLFLAIFSGLVGVLGAMVVKLPTSSFHWIDLSGFFQHRRFGGNSNGVIADETFRKDATTRSRTDIDDDGDRDSNNNNNVVDGDDSGNATTGTGTGKITSTITPAAYSFFSGQLVFRRQNIRSYGLNTNNRELVCGGGPARVNAAATTTSSGDNDNNSIINSNNNSDRNYRSTDSSASSFSAAAAAQTANSKSSNSTNAATTAWYPSYAKPFRLGVVLLFVSIGVVATMNFASVFASDTGGIPQTAATWIGVFMILFHFTFYFLTHFVPAEDPNVVCCVGGGGGGANSAAADATGIEEAQTSGTSTPDERTHAIEVVDNADHNADKKASGISSSSTSAASDGFVGYVPVGFRQNSRGLWTNLVHAGSEQEGKEGGEDVVKEDGAEQDGINDEDGHNVNDVALGGVQQQQKRSRFQTTPELWCLWFICLTLWGTITLVNSNITLIYKSILTDPVLYSDSFNGVFVSAWALASALGRVNIGYLSQNVYTKRKISVWHPLPLISAVMAIACSIFLMIPAPHSSSSTKGGEGKEVHHGSATPTNVCLLLVFSLLGFAGGSCWATMVLVMKLLFKKPGIHYAFLYTAGMLTPVVFSLGLFAHVYGAESKKQGLHSTADCYGKVCIRVPIIVMILLNSLGAVAGVFLVRRLDRGMFGNPRLLLREVITPSASQKRRIVGNV